MTRLTDRSINTETVYADPKYTTRMTELLTSQIPYTYADIISILDLERLGIDKYDLARLVQRHANLKESRSRSITTRRFRTGNTSTSSRNPRPVKDVLAFESAVREYDSHPTIAKRGHKKVFNCAAYARKSGVNENTCRDWLQKLRKRMKSAEQRGEEPVDTKATTQSIRTPEQVDKVDFMSSSYGPSVDQEYTEMMSTLDRTLSTIPDLRYDFDLSSQDQHIPSGYTTTGTCFSLSSSTTERFMEGCMPSATGAEAGDIDDTARASEQVDEACWLDPQLWYL